MIILDTNVISELYRKHPDTNVVAWVEHQSESDLRLCSITVAELLYGLHVMPEGQKKHDMAALIASTLTNYAGRILPFDAHAAYGYGQIAAQRKLTGHKVGMADTQIAGIAKSRDCAIATRNLKHFEDSGVEIINPWDYATN